MVREHLVGGLWKRFMDAANRLKLPEQWHSAFGYMVEMAAREMAEEAASSPQFSDRVIASSVPGTPVRSRTSSCTGRPVWRSSPPKLSASRS